MRYCEIMTEAASSNLPFKTMDEVFHVGTMNAAHKGSDSWEGAGLSVSADPLRWMRFIPHIMDRPEATIWRGTRPGNRFLDISKLTRGNLEAVYSWGKSAGYIDAGSMTPKMTQRVRTSLRMGTEIFNGLLCTVYVEDVLHIDGVWWSEWDGAPKRGVIVPSALAAWDFVRQDRPPNATIWPAAG
jgi:hypothetical protein